MIGLEFQITGQRNTRRLLQQARRAARDWSDARRLLGRALVQQARRWRIPVDSGRLRSSLTRLGHPDQIFHTTRMRIVFGTRVQYARHQRGLSRLPRPRLRAIEAVLERHILRTVQRRGAGRLAA